MFKNCVFKADVNTTQWVRAAVRRAVKTMAQTCNEGSQLALGGIRNRIGRNSVTGNIRGRPARG